MTDARGLMDRDDALFMMRFDQLYRPSRLAKQFV